MTPIEHLSEAEFQARKLLAYVKKGGTASVWWASKDFNPTERLAIEKAYCRLWGMKWGQTP